MSNLKNGIYRHYKGNYYLVIGVAEVDVVSTTKDFAQYPEHNVLILGVATHSELQRQYVVYVDLNFSNSYCLRVALLSDKEELVSKQDVVVYVPLYKTNGTNFSIRPLTMFAENVIVDGLEQPRFKFIGVTHEK